MVTKRVDEVKYLGITIDEKLTWNAHVEYVCNSLMKLFGIVKQLRRKVTMILFDIFIMHLYTLK